MIRTVCRYCAEPLGLNDHLFETEGQSRLSQQALRMNLIYPGRYNQSGDVSVERSMRKPLVNWRDYPPVCHVVQNGRVMALIDKNGRQLTRRFCPYCHGELDDDAFFGLRLLVGLFSEQDAPELLPAVMGQCVQKKDSAVSYPFTTLNISIAELPWSLQIDNPPDHTRIEVKRRLRTKQMQSADVLLIHLKADPGAAQLPGAEVGQLKMVERLREFREQHLMSGFFVQIPVAVVVSMEACYPLYQGQGGPDAFLTDLKTRYATLTNWLKLLFVNYELFVFAPDETQPQRAKAMIRWMMERVMAL